MLILRSGAEKFVIKSLSNYNSVGKKIYIQNAAPVELQTIVSGPFRNFRLNRKNFSDSVLISFQNKIKTELSDDIFKTSKGESNLKS